MAQLVEHFTRNEGVVGSSPISSLYVGAAHCAAFCITGFTKGEYDMKITRQMLFPLAFYKKSKFNGSKGNTIIELKNLILKLRIPGSN